MIARRASQRLWHRPQCQEARHRERTISPQPARGGPEQRRQPTASLPQGRSASLCLQVQGATGLSQACSDLAYEATPRGLNPQRHRRNPEDLFSVSLGHCLGGQLVATAQGAKVTTNPAPEVGWSHVRLSNSDAAHQWFGELAGTTRTVFQWHYESFALPNDAQRIATNEVCANQAFVSDTLLAMQFHIEVD
jgi:hypothetical protein